MVVTFRYSGPVTIYKLTRTQLMTVIFSLPIIVYPNEWKEITWIPILVSKRANRVVHRKHSSLLYEAAHPAKSVRHHQPRWSISITIHTNLTLLSFPPVRRTFIHRRTVHVRHETVGVIADTDSFMSYYLRVSIFMSYSVRSFHM